VKEELLIKENCDDKEYTLSVCDMKTFIVLIKRIIDHNSEVISVLFLDNDEIEALRNYLEKNKR